MATAFLGVGLACGAAEDRPAARPTPPFDGERAFLDLAELVRIGPRPSGSKRAELARAMIRWRLRQAGWRVEEQRFEARRPEGDAVPMVNVIGRRTGRSPGPILLGTHYDTKRIEGVRFLGANDGASGVALLLETARLLAQRPLAFDTWLVFFDGEEAFGPTITREDGLYGSRELAARMAADGSLERVRALIVVDMVGDADLSLTDDLSSSPALRGLLRETAADLGLEGLIDPVPLSVVDDHTPFAERGLAARLLLIDFRFGGDGVPGPFWHTERDDLAAVSAESLNTAGRLLVHTLERLEERLSLPERGSGG